MAETCYREKAGKRVGRARGVQEFTFYIGWFRESLATGVHRSGT